MSVGLCAIAQDNFDPSTNIMVLSKSEGKHSITEYGSPEEFLQQHVYLLGENVFQGASSSGGSPFHTHPPNHPAPDPAYPRTGSRGWGRKKSMCPSCYPNKAHE
jgi:hypothetical protein